MRTQRTAHRAGFTLVELLVSTALVLFIMAIIAEAIGAGSKTFTTLRTAGQLQERLRGGITIVRRDLANDHFGPPFGSNRGGPHLGDQRLDQPGWRPPGSGYVEIFQANPSVREPFANVVTDGEGLFSTRAVDHRLRFTVRVPDGPAPELLCARFHPFFTQNPPALSPDSQCNAFPTFAPMFYTRWAEVNYFLIQRSATPGGLPLYSLHRRVRLLPPKNFDYVMPLPQAVQIVTQCAAYPDVIAPYVKAVDPLTNLAVLRLPGPEALNSRDRDFNGNAVQRLQSLAHPTGDDIVMTDVISFEIKAAWFYNDAFNVPALNFFPSPHGDTMGLPALNSDEPFSDLQPSMLQPGALRRFDTGYLDATTDAVDWENPLPVPGTGFLSPGAVNPVPSRINIRALQIKIRIWDPRAEKARQTTIIQEV